MRGFRAKDADRDRYVEVIEAAYVDGQIGDADRELRVARALSAETLDELETLTRDLQNRPAPVAAAPTRPAHRPQRLAVAIAGLGALVVLGSVGVVGLVVLSAPDEPDLSSPTVEVFDGTATVPVEEAEVAEAPSFTMTAADVRRFVRAYERQFGTLDAYDVGFYPSRVGVQVPVRGSRPRHERWTWDGAWTQDTQATAANGFGATVDLGTLDVRRLFANIDAARRTLRVQRGRLTHVLFHEWHGEQPSVNIYIANTFNESGYLKTTPSGDIVHAFPYDA